MTLYLAWYVHKKIKKQALLVRQNLFSFALFGFLSAVSQFAAYTVLSMTYIGYATALFSLSSLLSVFLAGMIFKESNMKERIFGAAIMIVGVILLAL